MNGNITPLQSSMKEIQTPLLGSVFFDTTPTRYVPPPVAAIKALGESKEKDYLTTAQALNEIDTIKRNIPSQYSPEVASTIISTIDKAASQVTPENYANKVLDTQQLAYDLKNRMGLQNLVDQQKAVADAEATIKAAEDKGEIIDPAHAAYIRAKAKQSVKPLAIDPETGVVTKQAPLDTTYHKFYDIQKESLDNLAGWKANKTIITTPSGKLKVKGSLPGYLGMAVGTEVDEKELLQRLSQYHLANPKFQAYMQDMVGAELYEKPINMTGESIINRLEPKEEKTLAQALKVQTLTPADIDNAIADGRITTAVAKGLIAKSIIDRRVGEGTAFAAAKESYKEEDQQWYTDIIGKENRDFIKDMAKIEAQKVEEIPGEAIPFQSGSQEVSNDAAMETTNKLITSSREGLTAAQTAYNDYKRSYDPNDQVQVQELKRKEALVNQFKGDLNNAVKAQQSQATDIINTGIKHGVNIMKEYEKAKPELLNVVRKTNIKALIDSPFTMDVTGKVVIHDGVPSIKTPDGYAPVSRIHGVNKVGNKYILEHKPGYNTRNMLGDLGTKQMFLDKDGNIRSDIKQQISPNKLARLQSPQELKAQILEDYTKDRSGTWMPGKSYSTLKASDGKDVFVPDSVRNAIIDTKKKSKGILETGQAPLISFAGTGTLGKHVEETSKVLNNVFDQNQGAWKVYNNRTGASTDIAVELQQRYGIDLGSQNIADKKIVPTTSVDERGLPVMVMKIKPTPAAIKNDDGGMLSKAIGSDGYIDLNVTSDNPAIPQFLYNTFKKTYRTLATGNTPIDITNRQEVAKGLFNNSPQGQAIRRLNIGSMVSGESKPITLGNTHFDIKASGSSGSEGDIGNQIYSITGYSNAGKTYLAVNPQGQEAMLTTAQLQSKPEYKVFEMKGEDAVQTTLGRLMALQDKTISPNKIVKGRSNSYSQTTRRTTRY